MQTQHQSGVAMIAKNGSPEFKARVLPGAHQPQGWIAIGFSQLRRQGPPVFRAEQVAGGYVLNGHIPWI
ncbi:acyl-CoA dehydrogenase, partial [Acinetobacter baumannii]